VRAPRAELDLADRLGRAELVRHPDRIPDEVAPDDPGEAHWERETENVPHPKGLTTPTHCPTIAPTMSRSRATAPHALAEAAATYGAGHASTSHTKLSITLPDGLVDEVRAAARATGRSVSSVIAAAIASEIERVAQARLDAAIDLQNEESEAWSRGFLPSTARIWSEIEW